VEDAEVLRNPRRDLATNPPSASANQHGARPVSLMGTTGEATRQLASAWQQILGYRFHPPLNDGRQSEDGKTVTRTIFET
jgi:hypothetical protein